VGSEPYLAREPTYMANCPITSCAILVKRRTCTTVVGSSPNRGIKIDCTSSSLPAMLSY